MFKYGIFVLFVIFLMCTYSSFSSIKLVNYKKTSFIFYVIINLDDIIFFSLLLPLSVKELLSYLLCVLFKNILFLCVETKCAQNFLGSSY